tara:strand:+ start:9416 stop:10090 length:675 start_codon:yes stop_codon:yes gene_type:complete
VVNFLWSDKSVSCQSLLISGLIALWPLNSIAGLTDFIDIASFSSTATTLNTYTFNQFNNDIQISSSPLNFDSFSVSIEGVDESNISNLLDAAPFVNGPFDIDASTYLFLKTRPATKIIFDFDYPTYHFGATFRDIQNANVRMEFIVEGQSTMPSASFIQNDIRFYGFYSSEPFSSVELQSKSFLIDGFGMDNLMYSMSPVPLPAGIYLFLSGLVGLGLMRGRNA